MTYDFSFWLLLLTAIAGVVWCIDWLLFRRARTRRHAEALATASTSDPPAPIKELRDPVLVEYARSFFPVLVLVLVVRSFIFEPFRIPSDSMMPTLLAGDFIFVSKSSFDLRMPVFGTKLLETGDPIRGDVVVFKLPADPAVNYIKRLVGLPGDHVRVVNDRVFINDQPMPVELTGTYGGRGYEGAQLGQETLGDVKHQVMYIPGAFPRDFDAVVPAGHYFFMGDNRDNSQDSRYPLVGFVAEKYLVGRAKMIWFHWTLTDMPLFSRIGTRIS